MHVHHLTCPNCGAPLPLEAAQRLALCAYCNTSVRVVADPSAPGPTRLAADNVPRPIVEQVKQLVIAGRHDEAVALYAQHAGVPPAEAEAAMKQLITPLLFRLSSRMPLRIGAIPIFLAIIAAAAAGAAWAVLQAIEDNPAFALLALLCAAVAVWHIHFIAPKVVSTIVDRFGAEGHARIARVAVLRRDHVKGGTLVLVLMDVTPASGEAPFRDEEVLLLRNESVPKIEVGNIIRVRFDRGRDRRVFPFSPIEVVGRA